jgi:hypothetical protein
MENLGLVVHDDQGFLLKVVDEGLRTGRFTRDRADEIIRVSVAMANKYVLQKEVDFRSSEELAKVQQTVLKLIGVGLEIRSDGNVESGINALMQSSPVELFRLAYTRVERLRHEWSQLLIDHKVEIFVSHAEYESLSDITLQKLSDMSVFSETEHNTIKSLKLEDDLFSNLNLLQYYESELERYKFILRLRDILPFDLIRKSSRIKAQNLSEVECVREALVNSIIISAYNDSPDPVSITLADIRNFLGSLDVANAPDGFPEDIESLVVDLIHELAEGLAEREVELLTSEIVEISRKLLSTILLEEKTISSPNDFILFQRWSRIAIIQDEPKPLERIFSSSESVDEYDFELLLEQVNSTPIERLVDIELKIPWKRMTPDQIITFFHTISPEIQARFADKVDLGNFNSAEMLDLIDELEDESIGLMAPKLVARAELIDFSMEDLDLIGGAVQGKTYKRLLLLAAGPPSELKKDEIISEFVDGGQRQKDILMSACERSGFFGELVMEAWEAEPDYVKKYLKSLKPQEAAIFLERAMAGAKPAIKAPKGKTPTITFRKKHLNEIYKSLPKSKKTAALKRLSMADEPNPKSKRAKKR